MAGRLAAQPTTLPAFDTKRGPGGAVAARDGGPAAPPTLPLVTMTAAPAPAWPPAPLGASLLRPQSSPAGLSPGGQSLLPPPRPLTSQGRPASSRSISSGSNTPVGSPAVGLRRSKKQLKEERKEQLRLQRELQRRELEEVARAEAEAEAFQRQMNDFRDAAAREAEAELRHWQAQVDGRQARIDELELRLGQVTAEAAASAAEWQLKHGALQEQYDSTVERLGKVELESEERLVRLQLLEDELNTCRTKMGGLQKEVESHSEHMSEVSSTLHHQLATIEMENRVLRIERRNREAALLMQLRDMSIEFNSRLDELLSKSEDLFLVDERLVALHPIVETCLRKEADYQQMLRAAQEKVKTLNEWFYQLQPLHSNLPPRMRHEIEALSHSQLVLLLDVLGCHEPVMRFLQTKFGA